MEHTGYGYAVQSLDPEYLKLKYSQCDCQGFVERVLRDYGVRSSSGKPYNWRGSNHIWRVALSWKGTKAEAYQQFGDIPDGALAFTVKYDGGEEERGYHDGEGNATHVGIYSGQGTVMNSTRTSNQDGVGPSLITEKRWTHIGLLMCLDYSRAESGETYPQPVDKPVDNVDNTIVNRLKSIVAELTTLLNEMEEKL